MLSASAGAPIWRAFIVPFTESPMPSFSRRDLLAGATACLVPSSRVFAQPAPSGPFRLDPLPYPAAKNEPHIDAQTMDIHHGRHHAAYVNNLNAVASQNAQIGQTPLHELLAK